MFVDRREFLATALAASIPTFGLELGRSHAEEIQTGKLSIAPFQFDATPPIGHSCCGGWIPNISVVDDTLEALGFVILGAGQPLVVCAIDWTGLLNSSHLQFRQALAEGAGTTADRVAVHCVHQHNAPMACSDAEKLVAAQGDLPHILDLEFFARLRERGRTAVAAAIAKARPLTHIATGQARVDRVASNRRVSRDEQGRIKSMRGSACKDPALIALPEGTIDPFLKTIAWYSGETRVVACHYYATHPMSYYGDGRATSDFAGLARKQRQAEDPGCLHVYFTGCAGNVSAGKYNDGSKEARPLLTQRVYEGIVASEKELQPRPLTHVAWRTQELLPVARKTFDASQIEQALADKSQPVVNRNRPAYTLAWIRRVEARLPILVSSLLLNDQAALLHLPAECFIEYQLRAQSLAPQRFVATAAYGDGGPWYIPVKEEYPNGGYEVGVAFCEPGVDDQLTTAMQGLLASS
jgi:hypothetical protein